MPQTKVIARVSLVYLLSGDVSKFFPHFPLFGFGRPFPFADYAGAFWAEHARDLDDEKYCILQHMIQRLFDELNLSRL